MESQRRAIKAALSQSIELRRKLLPYLIIKDGVLLAIEFEQCLKRENLDPSLQSGMLWLFAIWTGHDLIKKSRSMDAEMKAAILRALKALWR